MSGLPFNYEYGCPACGRWHAIRQCTRFLVLTIEKKLRFVADKKLCSSCLAQTHLVVNCRSIDRCKRCRQKHNTMLHAVAPGSFWFPMSAQVRIYPQQNDKFTRIRLLIDPNASRSSIDARRAKVLGCDIRLGRTVVRLCHSQGTRSSFRVDCAVENFSGKTTPAYDIDRSWRPKSREIQKSEADGNWHIRSQYHMIVGADYAYCILEGKAEGRPGQTYIQNTIFGVVYFGEAIMFPYEDEDED